MLSLPNYIQMIIEIYEYNWPHLLVYRNYIIKYTSFQHISDVLLSNWPLFYLRNYKIKHLNSLRKEIILKNQ